MSAPMHIPARSRRLAAALALVLLGAPLGVSQSATTSGAPEALKAGTFSPARQAPDFALQGSDGRELKLSQYRGKIVVLGFGFTSCPDVCPITLGTLAQAKRDLAAAGADVQIIYVTVDPERDDAGRMRNYLAGFDKTFLGATGPAAKLSAVRNEYGVLAERKTYGSDFTYSHSSFTYLIDRNGKLRALMPYGRSPADYVHDLKILLKE